MFWLQLSLCQIQGCSSSNSISSLVIQISSIRNQILDDVNVSSSCTFMERSPSVLISCFNSRLIVINLLLKHFQVPELCS
mmetsp:Transcript_50908/g.148280  ORF Transcript_50908/g.148280 Transcript_50908/m.148280 type:complete len:80 (+) Transcript_50908:99-338(+)